MSLRISTHTEAPKHPMLLTSKPSASLILGPANEEEGGDQRGF